MNFIKTQSVEKKKKEPSLMTTLFYLPTQIQFTTSKISLASKANGANADQGVIIKLNPLPQIPAPK
jgi:hypothetical protein